MGNYIDSVMCYREGKQYLRQAKKESVNDQIKTYSNAIYEFKHSYDYRNSNKAKKKIEYTYNEIKKCFYEIKTAYTNNTSFINLINLYKAYKIWDTVGCLYSQFLGLEKNNDRKFESFVANTRKQLKEDALSLYNEGKYIEASAYFETFRELGGKGETAKANFCTAEEYYSYGLEYLKKSQYVEAYSCFNIAFKNGKDCKEKVDYAHSMYFQDEGEKLLKLARKKIITSVSNSLIAYSKVERMFVAAYEIRPSDYLQYQIENVRKRLKEMDSMYHLTSEYLRLDKSYSIHGIMAEYRDSLRGILYNRLKEDGTLYDLEEDEE